MLVVRTSGDGKRSGLTLFVVDTDSDSLGWDTMVSHAEHQYFVYFDDVNVPKENTLGKIDGGVNVLFDALNPERMVVAAGGIGGGRHALQRAVDYANEREFLRTRLVLVRACGTRWQKLRLYLRPLR